MKKGIVVAVVLVLAAGAAGGGYYYWTQMRPGTEEGERVSSDSENAVYVDSVSVLAGLGSGNGLIQRYSGVVEPQQTWEVKLENERTVKECLVKEGDEVKEGQKLFTYDTAEDEDKLAQAEIDLERSKNEMETAKVRKEQLEKEKAKASADEQLNFLVEIKSAEATIMECEYNQKAKTLEIAKLKENIQDAAVYSEINGVVKSINDPNSTSSSYMDSSDSAYITVLEVGAYRIKGMINEQNLQKQLLVEGMDMVVHSRVDDTQIWRGTITEINRDGGESSGDSSYMMMGASDSTTSSTNYPYYVELESSEGMILGQHVYLEPDMGQADKKEGIWLDEFYFVTEEDSSSYVWAASGANTLEKRSVTLGEYDEELGTYQVTEGLSEKDYIAVPTEEFAEGLPVIYNDFSDMSGMAGEMDMSGYEDGGEYSEDLDLGMEEDADMLEGIDDNSDPMMEEPGYEEDMFYEDVPGGEEEGVYEEGSVYEDSGAFYDADADGELAEEEVVEE